jgi:phosphoglycolate phosphatase-like HAD superfamily hydrolase
MPINLAKVKALCFDVDGTLSDTDDQLVHKLVRILSPTKFIYRKGDVLSLARRLVMYSEGPGNWVYSLADRMGMDDKIVRLGDRLYDLGIGEIADPYLLINGIRELLVKLMNKFPLSIISARGHKSTLRFLFQFELVPFFSAIATGQTCIHTKPYPDQIIWAAQMMGVPTEACLMIGDTAVDILAGRRAGAQTIGVLCGFGEEDELIRAGADHIIKCTTDLSKLLQLE